MDSALLPCINAAVSLPRLLFLEDVPKLDATVLRHHLERSMPTEHAMLEAPGTAERKRHGVTRNPYQLACFVQHSREGIVYAQR
jgi:hypothetical protein